MFRGRGGKDIRVCVKSYRASWKNNYTGTLVWVKMDRDFVFPVAIERSMDGD